MDKRVEPAVEAVAAQHDVDNRMRLEIRDIGIPPRPAILSEIDREMEKDEPDFGTLAKLIGSDVALAAGLIKTTNSPFFGFSKKVRTIHEAMLVLGLKVVIRTIAGLSTAETAPISATCNCSALAIDSWRISTFSLSVSAVSARTQRLSRKLPAFSGESSGTLVTMMET